MDEFVRLTLDEAVPLAHALVGHVAAERGIRVVFIKGPILGLQGLRDNRPSTDADVLCDPLKTAELGQALTSLGWVTFTGERTMPKVIGLHATTYAHERWPCTIDVHHLFPGLLAPPSQVFERLWSQRDHAVLAAKEVPCSDMHASMIIAALHLLRTPTSFDFTPDMDDLVERVRHLLDEQGLRELSELAVDLGAADTLQPFLDRIGAPRIGRGTTTGGDLDDWSLLTTAGALPVVIWLEELRRSPLRGWPRIIWRGLTLDEDKVTLSPMARSGPTAAMANFFTRLLTAMRYTPRAARELMRWRKSQ